MVCLVPLVRNPFYFFQSERTSLETIELERLSFISFLEAKEDLICGRNPNREEKEVLVLKGFPKKTLKKRVELIIPKSEKENHVIAHVLVRYQIGKKEKEFSYDVLLKNTALMPELNH